MYFKYSYSRDIRKRISKDMKRITIYNITHMMSMVDYVVIGVETPRIDSRLSLAKEFIELICTNPLMLLHPSVNQVYSYQDYVCGPQT